LAFCLFASGDFFLHFSSIGPSLHVQFVYNMMAPWITVINPMVTIWINRPYRDTVKKAACRVILANAIHPSTAVAQSQ
jgi:hypothetical protein